MRYDRAGTLQHKLSASFNCRDFFCVTVKDVGSERWGCLWLSRLRAIVDQRLLREYWQSESQLKQKGLGGVMRVKWNIFISLTRRHVWREANSRHLVVILLHCKGWSHRTRSRSQCGRGGCCLIHRLFLCCHLLRGFWFWIIGCTNYYKWQLVKHGRLHQAAVLLSCKINFMHFHLSSDIINNSFYWFYRSD